MHQPRQLWRILIPTLIAWALNPADATADILGFGDFSTWTYNHLPGDVGSPPAIVGPGTIELTNSGLDEERSLFHQVPQDISQFTASFVYEALTNYPIGWSGAAFVLQNSPAGHTAVGDNFFGYSGITNSAAVTLESSNATGFFSGGVLGGGSVDTSPVTLFSGNPIRVTLSYNGATLQEMLTDTITSATFSRTYLVNLPSIIGSATAYVGVTAGTYPLISSVDPGKQVFSDFQFTAVPEPSSLALLAMGVLGFFAYARPDRRALGAGWRSITRCRWAGSALAGVVLLGGIETSAKADFVYTHNGDADPATEGFTGFVVFGASSTFGPIANDLGNPAWSITGTAQSSQYAYASGPLSASELTDIATQGFTLTMIARAIQGIAPTYTGADPVGIAGSILNTGSQRFDIALGLDANGDTVVFLPTSIDATGPGSSLEGPGPSYTLVGAGNGYHTYTLDYDPVTQLADLFVDGILRIQDYAGNTTFLANAGLVFGAASGGQANHTFVQVVSVPEPSSLALIGIGVGGVAFIARLRRGRFRPLHGAPSGR